MEMGKIDEMVWFSIGQLELNYYNPAVLHVEYGYGQWKIDILGLRELFIFLQNKFGF